MSTDSKVNSTGTVVYQLAQFVDRIEYLLECIGIGSTEILTTGPFCNLLQ